MSWSPGLGTSRKWAAIIVIAAELGIRAVETARKQGRQAEIDAKVRLGTTNVESNYQR